MKKLLVILLFLSHAATGQLIRNHMLGGNHIVAPTLAYSQGTDYNKTTPLNVSIPSPAVGNLMVLSVGTNQSRVFTYPAGWTQVLFTGLPSGSLEYAYKFAAAGEPTTINVSWGGGGTTTGQVYYLEIAGARQLNTQAYGGGASTNTASSTTHQYGSHNIPNGVFAIESVRFAIGTAPTAINSGYTRVQTGGVHTVAYQGYPVATAGVNATWTVSPASTGILGIMGFYGLSR